MSKTIAKRHGRNRRPAVGSLTPVALALVGLGLIGLVGLLGGCSSQGPTYGGGKYDPKLGNPDEIPDAVPRLEPKSKYGNMETYVVRGRRYYTKDSSKGHVERGLASWYGPYFHRRKTSSGERYDMYSMTAAHKTLPLPTYARVTNMENGRSAVVKINDRGPFHDPRIIDLSYAAATKLGVVRKGTALVEVRAIDPSRPNSDPGPFLAAKKAGVPAPMLADNEPRSRPSMFGDDDLWSGASTRTRNEPRSRYSMFGDDEPWTGTSAPARARSESRSISSTPSGGERSPPARTFADRQAPSRISLAGEDDWLEGTRIVEGPTARSAAPEALVDAGPEPAPAARSETRERAYETALAALDATPDRAPARPLGIEPAVRSAPRVSAPIERVSAPIEEAPALAAAERIDAAEVAVPVRKTSPKVVAAARKEVPKVAVAGKPDAVKVSVAATKAAPKVAVEDKKDENAAKAATASKRGLAKVAATPKKDTPPVAASGKKDEPKVAAAAAKGGSKVDVDGKKDSAKIAAPAKKDAPKVAAAAPKSVAKTASTAKTDAAQVPAGKGVYLQVGAFGDPGNAERLRKKLSPHVAGQVRVQRPDSTGSTLYKVRVGPFGSEGEARKASAKLASLGVGESRRVVN
jgi:rare lipoprotein A (peptidoglycan hydrolase)/cell division protein FtsN